MDCKLSWLAVCTITSWRAGSCHLCDQDPISSWHTFFDVSCQCELLSFSCCFWRHLTTSQRRSHAWPLPFSLIRELVLMAYALLPFWSHSPNSRGASTFPYWTHSSYQADLGSHVSKCENLCTNAFFGIFHIFSMTLFWLTNQWKFRGSWNLRNHLTWFCKH